MLRRTPWGDAGEIGPGISFRLRNRVREALLLLELLVRGSAPFEGRDAHH
jgi:hypothetical protein